MRAEDHRYLAAPTPIALAHRGGPGLAENAGMENTLPAFRRAVAMGYRYVETDVHATRDGRVVAFHDASLDRATDARGRIADLPWSVVREARVGGRAGVPLLEELLTRLPDTFVNIDVKADSALVPTVEMLREHAALDRVCLGSFSPRRIRAARRLLGPEVATAAGQVGTALLRFSPAVVGRLLHTPAPVLQIPAEHRVAGRTVTLVTPELVRRAHALGKHVHVWFHGAAHEDAAEFHRLLDLGVDGLVVDRIDVLRDVFAERGHPLTPRSEG